MRRLDAYRTHNTEDETVLNYFDELEFHPEKIGELIGVLFCLFVALSKSTAMVMAGCNNRCVLAL